MYWSTSRIGTDARTTEVLQWDYFLPKKSNRKLELTAISINSELKQAKQVERMK
jgi:hypothetical protein